MWLKCKLTFNNYVPEKLEKGMMFLREILMGKDTYTEVYVLSRIPNISLEEYIQEHGFPVVPSIIYEGNGNESPIILVNNDIIGWWDEGEYSDEYFDVTIKELNFILQEYYGEINLLMEDNGESLFPDIFEGKCIISYPEILYKTDLYDTDFKKYVNQEEQEEW